MFMFDMKQKRDLSPLLVFFEIFAVTPQDTFMFYYNYPYPLQVFHSDKRQNLNNVAFTHILSVQKRNILNYNVTLFSYFHMILI